MMKVGHFKMIVVNTGAIARHFKKHREEENRLSRMQTYDSHIDKSMRQYKVLCLAKKITEELSDKNGIVHEADIDEANYKIIYIISKMKTNEGKMGIKRPIKLNKLILDNYKYMYEQEILATIRFNEDQLINSNKKKSILF